MPNHPKSVTVAFTGIVASDVGLDPNRTYQVRYNNHSDPSAPTFTLNERIGRFNVNITFALTEPPNNFLQYNIFDTVSQVGYTVFMQAAPGLTLKNMLTYGGTAEVTLNS